MQRDALEFWEAIAGKVKQTARNMMEKSLQCERYDVTTAPDGSKIGVKQPFGTREIFIPYSAEVANAKVGDTVLVMWWNSLSTAKAWYFGSGPAASYDGLISRMLDVFYPVGSVYISSQPTDPGTLFGGTWTRIKDRFILAAGDTYAAGATGGEEKHTLTESEMPVHHHTVNISTNGTGLSTTNRVYWNSGLGSADKNAWGFGYTSGDLPSGASGVSAVNTGGGTAHNNMPPYFTRYVWERTA